jgi:cobalt-zinc-cadmium efflux system membrane fusion protein
MKNILIALLLVFTVPAAATGLIAVSAAQRAALGIEVAALQPVDEQHGTLLPARVAVPNAQLQVVSTPYQGLVEVLLVAEGETVRAGQALVRIQSPQLLELQSDYLETLSRYTLAGSNYRRDQQLNKEGIIAKRRLLESQAAFAEVSTTLARLRRLLELAGLDAQALESLEKDRQLSSALIVRSPLDGVVLEQLITAGKRVEAADPLYRIADLAPLWLEIHMPLEQLGTTSVGQPVFVPELGVSGKIITVGRVVHSADQGVLVRAEISEGLQRMSPGQFLQVQLTTVADSHHFRVPRTAVAHLQGHSFIFAASADGFTPVEVTVASEQSSHLVVAAALSPDTRIAVTGAAAIKAIWQGEQP